jgi:hypothetical protein
MQNIIYAACRAYLGGRLRQVHRSLNDTSPCRQHPRNRLETKLRTNADSHPGGDDGLLRKRSVDDFRRGMSATTFRFDRWRWSQLAAMQLTE